MKKKSARRSLQETKKKAKYGGFEYVKEGTVSENRHDP